MYDSTLHSFLSPDPTGQAGGGNLYEALKDDPINFTDPDGTSPEPVNAQASTSKMLVSPQKIFVDALTHAAQDMGMDSGDLNKLAASYDAGGEFKKKMDYLVKYVSDYYSENSYWVAHDPMAAASVANLGGNPNSVHIQIDIGGTREYYGWMSNTYHFGAREPTSFEMGAALIPGAGGLTGARAVVATFLLSEAVKIPKSASGGATAGEIVKDTLRDAAVTAVTAGVVKGMGKTVAALRPAVADGASAAEGNLLPQTLKEVDLPGRIRAAGVANLRDAGEFFGWEPGYVSKGAADFTKEQLLAAGWTRERLLNVAEGYEHVARITPANPSAAGRAIQLRQLAELLR